MKRLVPALAAVVLGSGCIVTTEPCQGTITVDWLFQRSDGVVTGCAGALVDWVDVYMNGARVADGFPCSAGSALITGVEEGTYEVVIEGLDGSGRIAYRDSHTVATSCGDDYLPATPAEGVVDIQYYFAPDVCNSPAYMWFSVRDEIAASIAAEVSSSSALADKVSYPCDTATPLALAFSLPAGTYTLDWIQEMVQTGPTTFAVTGRNCADIGFTISGAYTTPVSVLLSDATTACVP